ncbi:MAG: hypothetical protein ACLR0U_21140 [Enterocloster clostridioformis]
MVIQDGVCRWRSSFKIELDAAYFETLVHKAEGSQDGNGPRCSFRLIKAITESCCP